MSITIQTILYIYISMKINTGKDTNDLVSFPYTILCAFILHSLYFVFCILFSTIGKN